MEEKQKEQEGKEKQVRKWKGKDWFVILAPEIYGKTVLSETPATDPKALIGRIIEISFAELSGNPSKFYMKLMFRIEKVDGKKALTQFNGYAAARDYLFRVVRKRTQKIRIISNMETKDKWKLQITALAVLNRNTETGVQKTKHCSGRRQKSSPLLNF
jgi:small subunit ribosomal protein S3Ae